MKNPKALFILFAIISIVTNTFAIVNNNPENPSKISANTTDDLQTCPISNTFSNGNGGAVHTFTYNDVESMSFDFDFVDNSFQIDINGTAIHANTLELSGADLGTGESHLKFTDNTNVPESWLHEVSEWWKTNYNGLPRLRIVIDNGGNIQAYGTRETTSTVLEALSPVDGSFFNNITFPSGTSTVTITNFDETGNDGISGTVTAEETCNGTVGVWAENGPTLYYNAGNVAINTDVLPTGYNFAVNGKIIAEEIKVQVYPWADFVFAKEYKLPTLLEVEQYIIAKGHLQNIPSAAEAEKNGIQLGQMNAKLLQKIEELTLYAIQQDKEIRLQKQQNEALQKRLEKIEAMLSKQ